MDNLLFSFLHAYKIILVCDIEKRKEKVGIVLITNHQLGSSLTHQAFFFFTDIYNIKIFTVMEEITLNIHKKN